MRVTFLGTGTSTGVPQVGCPCKVCQSKDPHDKRLRSSLMVETKQTRLIIDCGPDFREQMLGVPFRHIDAIFLTHEHADHVGGLDDVRPFSIFGDVRIYGEERVLESLRQRMPYCFSQDHYPGVPRLELLPLTPHRPVNTGDLKVQPLRILHGHLPILGFRIGPLAYITDMTLMPESERPYLAEGVKLLVVNALRETPHPTHQNLEQACLFARSMGTELTLFTHMSHDVGLHDWRNALLPPDMQMAHDGLTLEL